MGIFSGYPDNWLSASRRWRRWDFTKSPRSTIETTSNQGQCLKSLENSRETFHVFRRIKSENSWKWNIFNTAMNLPLSSSPATCSLPQNTAYFAFFLDFLHLFSDSDHFSGILESLLHSSQLQPCCLPYPDKSTRKNQCFDSTLGKRVYKALSEKQSLYESCGGSHQTKTIFRICAQRYWEQR